MRRRRSVLAAIALVGAALPFALASACTLSGTGLPPALDAGYHDVATALPDVPVATADGGFTLPPNPPVDQGALAAGQLLVTASGESLAISGYDFPAHNPGDPVFADGWEMTFSHFIVTFDDVMLWDNPDLVPTDQSKHGGLVAEITGPWAVDLSHHPVGGFPYIPGKEQGSTAVAFAVVANQNQNGGAAFPRDGTRFAVGFSAVVATPRARNVNLESDALAAYQSMIERGCVALYVGTATWKGDWKGGLCATPSAAGDGGVSNGTGTEPEFAALPRQVAFDLCFKPRGAPLPPGTVETSYVNCDNQDNDPGPPLDGEPHQRGVAFKANTYTVGEITFHTDHPFWESTLHDTPLHFDQLAARAVGVDAGGDGGGGTPTVHLEDVLGVDYRAFTDARGAVLPWRICDPQYQNPNGGARVGQMAFDPRHVSPTCADGDPSTGFCDYLDFSKYNQSTQGHYNGADGLCFIERMYPSPP